MAYPLEEKKYISKDGEIFKKTVGIFGDKIVDFPNYQISNYGTVLNKKLKCKDFDGIYPRVHLYNNNKAKHISIHIYVALFFVEGRTDEKCWVNHKDENKKNYHYSNLEWVTPKENANYSSHKLKKAVDQFDIKTGNFVQRFSSATDAVKILGGSAPNISFACTNISKTALGFMWKFADLKDEFPQSTNPIQKICNGKAVNQYDLNNNFIRSHINISEAARFINGDRSSISKCCNKSQKTAYNFKWEFSD